jgi:drug/metabolite transporter (DMT)-like permease
MIAVLRTVLAGVVAAPLLAATHRGLPDGGRRRLLTLSAISGFVAFPLVYTVGQQRTSALHGVVILAALPVFTGMWAALVARRRPGRWWVGGCAVALLGELVIIAARAGHGGTEPTLAGDALVLAAALVVSAGYVAGALLAGSGYPSSATTFWGVVLGALMLLPLGVVLVGVDGAPAAGAGAWAAVLFLAVVTSILGYVGWYWALDRGGIARTAPLQFLQPISGLVLAGLVLGERLNGAFLFGAAAVLVGVRLARRA